MPPRTQPTARQERLGAELRRMREASGRTAREAAALLGTNPIQMSQMESGKAGISEERLRRLASHYACDDAALLEGLVAMATGRTQGWWDEYRGVLPPSFLDLAELEHHAAFLRIISVVHVPGLLQTSDYARAVFSFMVPELPPQELEPRVEHRVRRRSVLAGSRKTPYTAVIHESALRIKVADHTLMLQQWRELIRASEQPHITLRIIPFTADGFGGANCSMLHVGGVVPQLDTVQRDTAHGSGFVHAAAELVRLRKLFDKVEAMALDADASRDFLYGLTREA
ncbi:helix-turn-helix transcriptional regulator [Streptomyces sp. DSM 42041]|uniref:Helix-turn-helix transcriptional regulator n=1 Tax=Streptomyces hazeniae TaxID=3075538 RepID=A0ABU2NLI6_9ACTN|nr:helix-turn-helix transcriptional regulator [Streptomyces sp. DSM 42041]MDT0377620.1 helix-turn-helix transcriptional regulator [Streptomyces sp. DSM 42041]